MKAVPRSRYVLFGLIAGGGCLVDLVTKHWAFARLGMPGGPTHWLVADVFGLQTSLNEGALFGMGQGRVLWFAALAVVALLGVLAWLFLAGAARDRFLTVTLACVSAGILGNLYDRLALPGLYWNYASPWHELGEPVFAVRDWILVMIGPWHWPNFNVADSLLVCGAVLLALHAIRDARAERVSTPAA
ncbi:MAG: signal peptidase II [Pirellulales bacterium]|nr:signal peptidase II [Pirellulales bacterium]